MEKNSFWDFKSYDEKKWFKFLVWKTLITGGLYVIGHVLLNLWCPQYSYEYTVLNQDQVLQITHMYADVTPKSTSPAPPPGGSTVATKKDTGKKADTTKVVGKVDIKVTPKAGKPDTAKKTDTTCCNKLICTKVIDYLDNVFEGKLDPEQKHRVQNLLCELKSTDAPTILSKTRFKVESYFWLTGPFVYLEIIFWSILGVLSSLLFNLGVLGRNATTDLANPQSYYDSSEVPFQVAKIIYAPICTLAVILGYNFFTDQNIVDISSSKGVLVFAFICGFYSSRLIALMDRLKEVLLPNSGTSTLPGNNPPIGANALIPVLTIKVTADRALLTPAELTAAGPDWLNKTVVTIKSTVSGTTTTGSRMAIDPLGTFTFKNLATGNYNISADYSNGAGAEQIHLSATQTGQINSGTKPIELKLERVSPAV